MNDRPSERAITSRISYSSGELSPKREKSCDAYIYEGIVRLCRNGMGGHEVRRICNTSNEVPISGSLVHSFAHTSKK